MENACSTKDCLQEASDKALLNSWHTPIPATCQKNDQVNILTNCYLISFRNDEKFFIIQVFKSAIPHVQDWALQEILETKALPIIMAACSGFALRGQLDRLKTMREHGLFEYNQAINIHAAKGGHQNILAWTREIASTKYKMPGEMFWGPVVAAVAAEQGNLPLLKWLKEHKCVWTFEVCDMAASNGYLEILQYARANGCDWGANTCAKASAGGHLEILKWCIENDCRFEEIKNFAAAAEHGHLHVIEYLHSKGYKWDAETTKMAASGGHFELLVWVRERGCPWTYQTLCGAVRSGHLEMAKWAFKEGCPMDQAVCRAAAQNGRTEILRLIVESGYKIENSLHTDAIRTGHTDTATWLLNYYGNWADGIYTASISGFLDFELVKYGLQNGKILPSLASEVSVFANRSDVLQWLRDNRYHLEREKLKNLARKNNKWEIVHWLSK